MLCFVMDKSSFLGSIVHLLGTASRELVAKEVLFGGVYTASGRRMCIGGPRASSASAEVHGALRGGAAGLVC